MKKWVIVTVIAGLVFVPLPFYDTLTGIAQSTDGSCVNCVFQEGCRACAAGGSSAQCRTTSCSICVLYERCPNPEAGNGNSNGNGNRRRPRRGKGGNSNRNESSELQSRDDPCSDAAPSHKSFQLPSDVIMEVAQKHPRFAATLATVNTMGFKKGVYWVRWTPVEISAGDIDAFLDRDKYADFFSKLDESAKKLNKLIENGELSEITYQLSVNETASGAPAITLEVLNKDTGPLNELAFSRLRIEMVPVNERLISPGSRRPLVTRWRMV